MKFKGIWLSWGLGSSPDFGPEIWDGACMSDGLLSDADVFWVTRDGGKLCPVLPQIGIWSWGTISIFKCNANWGYFSILEPAEEFYEDSGE